MVDCSREIGHEPEHDNCLWCCWCDCFGDCHISRSECEEKELDYWEGIYKGGFGG
jgi:hypothetical protein